MIVGAGNPAFELVIEIDNTAKRGLTQFKELLPWFLACPKISNLNNIVIWKPLGLKLKMKGL